MTFDIREFKKNTKEFVRPTFFRVLIDNDETFSFLISAIEIREDRATLTISEQEDFIARNTIIGWEKLRRLQLDVEVFSKGGEKIKTLTGLCNGPANISYTTKLDWGDMNNFMTWKVVIPILWQY